MCENPGGRESFTERLRQYFFGLSSQSATFRFKRAGASDTHGYDWLTACAHLLFFFLLRRCNSRLPASGKQERWCLASVAWRSDAAELRPDQALCAWPHPPAGYCAPMSHPWPSHGPMLAAGSNLCPLQPPCSLDPRTHLTAASVTSLYPPCANNPLGGATLYRWPCFSQPPSGSLQISGENYRHRRPRMDLPLPPPPAATAGGTGMGTTPVPHPRSLDSCETYLAAHKTNSSSPNPRKPLLSLP